MNFVIDASIILKWVFRDSSDEKDIPQALELLKGIKKGVIQVYQPIHWFAEVTAVLARVDAENLDITVELLSALEFQVIDNAEIYLIAIELAKKFQHHLFDTLYHAVAIYQGNAKFITADLSYLRKTKSIGYIQDIRDFSLSDLLPAF